MGIPENSAVGRDLLAALADGRAVETGRAAPPADPEVRTPAPAPPALVAAAAAVAVEFTVPVVTASEANGREWRARSRRTVAARRAVSELLGRHLAAVAAVAAHYHAGGALDVTLTRLGGRRLDATANLGPAVKAVEDAVCLLLGARDDDPRWRSRAAQEPGGPVGVRVRIATAGPPP